ncbi:TIGR04086 family membrane protein [Halobacillus amylolyticus]|uniref:TIGR04086 family membrane protein n=1 Tax=Halobacillus amylolyticus TaxID=2932259 RepID=A0ABY4HBI6_9BACI|nr:TIGR04086 family membrane protein [Halobacillus amylolyticus]UOR12202.1 TIGR04086 family membrane protein [Halobacillus amylolyticus]
MKKLMQGVLGYGIGSIMILMMVVAAVLAILLRFTSIDIDTLNQISLVAGLTILAFGGLIAAYKGEQKGWLSGILTGLVFVVAMIGFQLIFENSWVTLTQLSYFGGLVIAALLGGMIGVNMPRRSTDNKS